MKRLLPLIALAGAAVLGVGLLVVDRDDGPAAVQVAEVGRAAVTETVEAPGNVAARATATLSAPADGVVEAVLVADGEAVTAGQVLVRLASDSAQERLRSAETAAANAAASVLELPRADLGPLQDSLDAAAQASFQVGYDAAAQLPDPYQRAAAEQRVADAEQRYWDSAHAARTSVQQANAGVGSVETALNAVGDAQRAQAAAAVTSARGVVDALTVLAPIDGVVTLGGGAAPSGGGGGVDDLVGQLPAELQGQAGQLLGGGGGQGAPQTNAIGLTVGQVVSSGAPLLTVTDVTGLQVVAEVDETDVLLVTPGVVAVVELDAVPGAQYDATVTSVDVAPTTSSRGGVSYRVRLDLGAGSSPSSDGEAAAPMPRPGMSAIVDLQVRTSGSSALAVPSSAVLRDAIEPAVLVVEDGRVRRTTVVLGAEGEDRVEVLEGLAPGARVVARDVDQLTDGQAVSP